VAFRSALAIVCSPEANPLGAEQTAFSWLSPCLSQRPVSCPLVLRVSPSVSQDLGFLSVCIALFRFAIASGYAALH
jgi:hypothetical protein